MYNRVGRMKLGTKFARFSVADTGQLARRIYDPEDASEIEEVVLCRKTKCDHINDHPAVAVRITSLKPGYKVLRAFVHPTQPVWDYLFVVPADWARDEIITEWNTYGIMEVHQ